MRFSFKRNKYHKELLIDCFNKKGTINIESPDESFLVSFYEIIVIKNGEGIFKLDEEVIPYKRGTVLLLPPNKWRKWESIGEDFEGDYLIFEEESIASFFSDSLYLYRLNYFYNLHHPSYINLSETHLINLSATLDELQKEFSQISHDSMHLMRSILYYLLIQLNRFYKTAYQIETDIYQKTEILQFKKLLEEHIANKHKVMDYAALLGISKSHLNKLIQKHFKQTASQFIKERLLLEIKQRLIYSPKTVSEIAYELNFSEASNFIRFFQKAENITPAQYRIQNDNY